MPFSGLKSIDRAAHWQSPEISPGFTAAAGSVECGTRAAHRERTEALADAKEQLLRNACSPLRTARICNRNPRCFHISRGDSIHATLRETCIKLLFRCEALAAPKPPHSQKRPPILPGKRFLCEPCLVIFVSSVTFGKCKGIGEADE
jgi:hypothetical protein